MAEEEADDAALPVSAGPEEAEDDGCAVQEVADPEEAVVLAVAAALRRSSPAVMVTCRMSSVRSVSTPVEVPGSLASGPARVSTQVIVPDAMSQATSTVLFVFDQFSKAAWHVLD